MFYLNEAHKRHSEAVMAALAAQPRVTLEEALAQYDRICWRQKLGINLRDSYAWRVKQLYYTGQLGVESKATEV